MFEKVKRSVVNFYYRIFKYKALDQFWKTIEIDDILRVCLAAKDIPLEYRERRTGYTFLHRAVREGYYNSVDALISLGSNVDSVGYKHYVNPIKDAIDRDDISMIRRLVEAGANPFQKFPYRCAVYQCFSDDKSDILSTILSHCKPEYIDHETLAGGYRLCCMHARLHDMRGCRDVLAEYVDPTKEIMEGYYKKWGPV